MSDPWARFQPVEQAPANDPWAAFQVVAQGKKPSVSLTGDIAKSAGAGVVRGAMGIAGGAGDIRSLGESAVGWAAGKLGAGPRTQEALQQAASAVGWINPLLKMAPTTGKIKEAGEAIAGPIYTPQTTAGRYAGAASEFATGALAIPGGGIARNLISGASAGLGSEAAGQAIQGTSAEPYARVAGALIGGMAPAAASRVITPMPMDPARAKAVESLRAEGVPLTAGQVTGSRPLQYMESTLGDIPGSGGRAAALQNQQREAFTAAALRRAGENAQAATPQVMAGARNRIGGDLDNIAARASAQIDPKFAEEIGQATQNYVQNSVKGQRPGLPDNIAQALIDYSQNQGGFIAGRQIEELRKKVNNALKTAQGPEREFYRATRQSIDDLIERTGPEGIRQEWGRARGEYRNYKAIEGAVGGAGENAALGLITPQGLRNAIGTGGNRSGYVRGQGDLADLARAGNIAMPQLPQSGTQPRSYAQALLSAGSGIATGSATGDPMMALLGMAGPAAVGRALMSRPVQGYLANQAVPRMQQAIPMLSSPEAARLSQLLLMRPALPQQ